MPDFREGLVENRDKARKISYLSSLGGAVFQIVPKTSEYSWSHTSDIQNPSVSLRILLKQKDIDFPMTS